MRKRPIVAAILGAGLVAGMLPGMVSANYGDWPSSAGNVERWGSLGSAWWIDAEKGLLVLANVDSLADTCGGIPAGAGERQAVTLPNGVVVAMLHDDDVPVLVVPLAAPADICSDPDAWPVIASGTGNVRSTDNDTLVSGSRTNSFGSSVTGRVTDIDGRVWSLRAGFRAVINGEGELTISREIVRLTRRG